MVRHEQKPRIPLPKFCKYCQKTKPAGDFSMMKGSPDGLQYRCKTCVSDYRKANLQHLKQLSKAAYRRREEANPGSSMRSYREAREYYLETGKTHVDEETVKRLEKRLLTERKICKDCLQEKPLTDYYVRIRNGVQIVVRPRCKPCWCAERSANLSNRSRAKTAFSSSKKTASKKGYEFDLTLEFVQSLFQNPCEYCGDSDILMTVDRKNSDLGYLQHNCTAACIRCNLIKADMPYEAWAMVAPGMRRAHESGAFGDWQGRRNFNLKKKRQ